ncbi:MAG: PepSY-associated TM helix domain-containing protein [Pseudomonadota bacterium]
MPGSKVHVSEEFRAAMGWLHTWAGIGTSCLLFVIFWMGSLAVFDREIDQWMKPELRIATPAQTFSYGAVFDRLLAEDARGASRLFVNAPSEREPLASVFYTVDGEFVRAHFDPRTGESVDVTDSHAGTSFFYPFHYSLHVPAGIGYWIVGFCAMGMLVLVVSGLFIHRKIIKDFFTFRPDKSLRRSTLDLHNLSSLIALPLHVLFPLTGLMIFFSIYLPWSANVAFGGDQEKRFSEAFAIAAKKPSGQPLQDRVDVNALIAEVEATWKARNPENPPKADAVGMELAHDANAYLMVREIFPSRAVSMNKNVTAISVKDGEILQDVAAGPAKTTYAWLAGAHFIQFDSWALRWLYFAGGLLGSLMIASGIMFWMQSRIKKGGIEPRSVRVVRGLAIGSISGTILASGAYLVANRLIPAGSDGFGMGRANFEVLFFYVVWIGAFVHAAVRGRFAWREHCLAIAATAFAAILLNWLSTGDHPIAAYQADLTQVWSLDVVLFVGALVARLAAERLRVPDGEATRQKTETNRITPESALAK